MDYSAPSFPRVGQDMVLTCGYLHQVILLHLPHFHQEGLTFKAFEWSRQRERVEVSGAARPPRTQYTQGLFFHYGGSRASVYTVPGDHWLNRCHGAPPALQEPDLLPAGGAEGPPRGGHHRAHSQVQLQELLSPPRLHQASPRMSGRYRCQVSMTPDDEPEDSERLATRSTEVAAALVEVMQVMVVEGNPEEFAPGVEVQVHQAGAGLLLTCSAVGRSFVT